VHDERIGTRDRRNVAAVAVLGFSLALPALYFLVFLLIGWTVSGSFD
jgi:hypothetical protein